ncbi:hypothetical protein QKQ66_gp006 [Dione juno nucleopolyhedrovirus]|uniref:Uncharacterized protein n=1 Tax=Dione juno nucleopolyhedrovirus TaxID=2594175 RepID=A0AAE6H353_9ABAC|nr:hypothetical protein QKQ66_gp006 [Dione juno nucleopolyhedrovirus]QDL56931.1 hypothetical protein DijuNPV-ORF-6 [Dione juno nucleopolyhedrovirus]
MNCAYRIANCQFILNSPPSRSCLRLDSQMKRQTPITNAINTTTRLNSGILTLLFEHKRSRNACFYFLTIRQC